MGHDDFANTLEEYRREIQVHCYRMLGSLFDAEDLTQETMLRAWRARDSFAGRGSLRAWLYKIATNVCLDELERRPRRLLPQQVGPPADPTVPPPQPATEPVWLEPYPDHLLPDPASDPAARVAADESVRLAFLAALQMLPPRQRAVLILRDVLAFGASEAAALLETTVPAVNSLVHRARVAMGRRFPVRPVLPQDEAGQDLLRRYIAAWESADVAGLVALLQEEARFAMPPSPGWYSGRNAIGTFARMAVFAAGAGHWVLQPTRANTQPALAVYETAGSGPPTAVGIQVLAISEARIAEATTFMNPALFRPFRLPIKLLSPLSNLHARRLPSDGEKSSG